MLVTAPVLLIFLLSRRSCLHVHKVGIAPKIELVGVVKAHTAVNKKDWLEHGG